MSERPDSDPRNSMIPRDARDDQTESRMRLRTVEKEVAVLKSEAQLGRDLRVSARAIQWIVGVAGGVLLATLITATGWLLTTTIDTSADVRALTVEVRAMGRALDRLGDGAERRAP